MTRIDLIPTPEDRAGLYRTPPREEDCSIFIEESCELYLHGELRGIYIHDWPDAEPLRQHILSIKRWDNGRRMTGVVTRSRVFGYSPRRPLMNHKDYCSKASLAREQPVVDQALCSMAAKIENVLRHYSSERHQRQANEVTQRVRGDYIIDGSSFTSGIVNNNNPLQYHYDAGNFEGFFSAMLAFKENTSGGHLNLPEYNVKIAIGDRSMLLFDGQADLHGVTPIRKAANGYRYTVVYYTLEDLWRCLPYTEEIRRAQISRTKTEMKRAGVSK
jgi:hypothetical protein